MRPEARQHILPLGLLIAGLVVGGICWVVDGTVFWVLVGVAAALTVAGIVAAGRTEAAQKDRGQRG